MIVGNGLVAKAFAQNYANDEDVVIFASGVSNSKEIREEAFLREKQLLTNALEANKFMVYFSTCSVDDPELFNSPYVVHKKKMEALVLDRAQQHAIFRLPQVVGHTRNLNTLTNYLYHKIVSGSNFQVWRYAKRNLIDIDDIVSISNYLIKHSLAAKMTVNIASPFSISIPDLLGIFETVLGTKANYTIVEAGGTYEIDVERVITVANHLGIDFDETYAKRIIRKYYGG